MPIDFEPVGSNTPAIDFQPIDFQPVDNPAPVPPPSPAVPQIRNGQVVRQPVPQDNRSFLQQADDAFMQAKGAVRGLAGGFLGFVPSIVGELAGGPEAAQKVQNAIVTPPTNPAEAEGMDVVGKAMSGLPPEFGVHLPEVTPGRVKAMPKAAELKPVAEILKDEGKAAATKPIDFQPVPQWETPPVMPVTPEGQGILSPADMAWRLRAQQMEAEAKANQPRPPMPEPQGPMPVTPEGQGILPGDVQWRNQGEAQIAAERAAMAKAQADQEAALEPWKQRALFLQKQAMAEQAAREAPPPVLRAEMARPETEQTGATVGTPAQMEGLRASTEGLSYENIPPGGVVPRSAPTKGLEAPRKGQWVVDENGMPVRQGFAPEHELGPPMNLPIREGANDLGNAIQEANGPKLGVQDYWGSKPLSGGYAGKQRGAINPAIFEPGYDNVKRLNDNIMLRILGPNPAKRRFEPTVYAIDISDRNNPKAVGAVPWSRDNYMAGMEPTKDNLEAMYTQIDESHRGKGLAEAMYRFMNEAGNDIIPSKTQTELGKKMWEGFTKRGYTGKMEGPQRLRSPGGKQGGAVDFGGIADSIGNLLKSVRDKFPGQVAPAMKAEELSQRAQERAKAQVASNVLKEKLPSYYDPLSGEEAAAMAARASDIKSNPFTRSLASGMGFMATYHDNPLLKYTRRVMNKANEEANSFINKYVHGEGGTTERMNDLSTAERVRLNELITHLDKNEIPYTHDIGDRVGLTDKGKAYMDAWNKAAEAEWEWNKQVHGEQGVEQAPYRQGYAPSMDRGSYAALVTVGDKVVGKITADTPGDFFKAKNYYAGKYEGAKFSADTPAKARIPLGGKDMERRGGHLADVGTFLNLLTHEDSSYSALQQQMNKTALKEAMGISNFNYHNLAKTGIEGSLGDRPWLSPEQNANDRLTSMNRFLTDSARYHSLQAPVEELNQLMTHSAFDHMPQAKEYLGDYLDNVGGRYINDMGRAANAVANFVSKLPEAVPIVNKIFGPRVATNMAGAIKNRLSQLYMGWFNTAFMLSQLVQPVQNGIPLAMMAAKELGLSAADVTKSVGKGYADFIKFDLHDNGIWKTQDKDLLDAAKFAQDRGIMNFTEGEHVYSGDGGGKISKAMDYYGNMTMKIGEHAARTPVFFAMYDLMKKAGIEKQSALETAEHLTNQIMADYRPQERPLVYQGMGVAGPHTGALTTYKHNFIGTQALIAKYGKESGNYAPAIASAALMIGLAGITGVPGYDDLDTLYQQMRKHLTGQQRSFRQDVLSTLPEWLKTGVVSNVIGLNAQNKFSTSQLLGGDNPAAVISPYMAGAYDIGKAGVEAAQDPTRANLTNAAMQVIPQGFKQFAKSQLQRGAPAQTPEGAPAHWLLDRSGKNDIIRSDEDWRKAAIWGLTPQSEALAKQNLYQNKKNEKVREEAKMKAVYDFQAAVAQRDNDRINKALKDYEAAGGFPPILLRQMGKVGMQGQMSSQQRAEKIPKSPESISRYEEFQTK